MLTERAGSEITVTDKRRRRDGIERTRGGVRIPAICVVAIRKFIAAASAELRVAIPKA